MAFTVRAMERCFYGKIREEGDEFEISEFKHFGARYMEPIGWDPKKEADKAAKKETKPKNDFPQA